MTSLSDDLFRQDHRVQAAMRHVANTGSGFSVSKRKTTRGIWWAVLAGWALSILLIKGAGL